MCDGTLRHTSVFLQSLPDEWCQVCQSSLEDLQTFQDLQGSRKLYVPDGAHIDLYFSFGPLCTAQLPMCVTQSRYVVWVKIEF